MKRKKRRELEFSPNSLVVPSWCYPISKKKKIISAIFFVILIATIVMLEANLFSSPEIELVVILGLPVIMILALTAPAEFVINKVLKEMHKNDFDDEDDNEDQNCYKLDDDEEDDEADEVDDDENFAYEYEQYLENNLI